MHRQFFGRLAALAVAAAALSGCAQMTRHSNTLIFATNTSFGITAGTTASNVPSVSVGYERQEAVVMPLVANVKADDNGNLQPCAVSPAVQASMTATDLPPCILVGRRGDSLDTYSVLGSFGASFNGSGNNATASGGVAQYFATGLAAQMLALKGGAALVATSEAAQASAAASPPEGALAALLDDPARAKQAKGLADLSRQRRLETVTYLGGLPEADFQPKLAALDAAAGAKGTIVVVCKGQARAACLQKLGEGDGLDSVKPDVLADALAAVKK